MKWFKRVNDDWLKLTSKGKWEPSTKERAVEGSRISIKAIDNSKEPKEIKMSNEKNVSVISNMRFPAKQRIY